MNEPEINEVKIIGHQISNEKDASKKRLLLLGLIDKDLLRKNGVAEVEVTEIWDALISSGADITLPNGHYVAVSVFYYPELLKGLGNTINIDVSVFGKQSYKENYIASCINFLSRQP